MNRDFSFHSKDVAGNKDRRQYFLLDGPQVCLPSSFYFKERCGDEAGELLCPAPVHPACPPSHSSRLSFTCPSRPAPSAWSPTHSSMLWLRHFILSGVISPLISKSILGTYRPGEFIFHVLSFCLFILFMGFSRQEVVCLFILFMGFSRQEVVCHSLLKRSTFYQKSPP